MKHTIGILAHVDAGKTTFSEQLLYHTHSIRNRGRVDHQNAFLDTHTLEKQRGITIFSGQAVFSLHGDTYYLLDTPGHVDFSGEMERAVEVMDSAVVIVSCAEGVQGHTRTVWNLLQKHKIPTLFFLNKTDRAGADSGRTFSQICRLLTPTAFFCEESLSAERWSEAFSEQVGSVDDLLMERYFEGVLTPESAGEHLRELFWKGEFFPCYAGSALNDQGISEFLEDFHLLTAFPNDVEEKNTQPFSARVYKVLHDRKGNRITCIKILSGSLKVKESVNCFSPGEEVPVSEKINELRIYSGEKYQQTEQAEAGDLCAVTGLTLPRPGDGIGLRLPEVTFDLVPMLSAKVIYDSSVPDKTVLGYFQELAEEDPLLAVSWEEELRQITVRIMGPIQLEVLRELVLQRFGLSVSFGPCEVLYRETILEEVIGYGHFEPLRHYAEVHLRLSPAKRGTGIHFSSECSLDVLDSNFQHLIRTHVLEKEHKGILLGAPLTDVNISLIVGRAHEKHTEGGDFREAVYRAVRQGLEKAKNVVLEPYYAFTVSVDRELLGRILSDIQKRNGTFSDPVIEGETVTVSGRGPVASFLDYPEELISFSRGGGTIQFRFDGYELCHNSDEVVRQRGYDKDRDRGNTSDSVFCSHGAGFQVKWYDVEKYIHCK